LVSAIILRLQPLLKYEIWGSDSGEYFILTRFLVDRGFLSTEYHGWGLAYQYFPGAEVLIGATHVVTGLGLLGLLKVLLPVVSSFVVMIIFLLGKTAFNDERAGLIGAALVAVAMSHVFATSHPMPGTLGDLLLGLCFLLVLKSYEDRRTLPVLILATLALIGTHHLSTMFLIVPVIFATLLREFIRRTNHPTRMRVDLVYIPFLTVSTLIYWLWLAVPFRDEVMTKAFDVHPFVIAALAFVVLAVAAVVVFLRRKFLKFRYTPTFPSTKREIYMLGMNIAILTGCLLATAFIAVPGTNIHVELVDVLPLFPVSIIFALGITGVGPAEFSRKGFFVLAWSTAAIAILALGIITKNTVLVPYRLLQYITFPLALMAGWGFVFLVDNRFEPYLPTLKRTKLGVGAILATLVILAGATAYPSPDVLGGFEEGTLDEEMDAVVWCDNEIPERGTMMATDHRMSSMLFGFAGLNSTWDSAYDTMHEDLNGSRDELRSVNAPVGWRRIDYVLLDEPIKEGVALVQWENAEPMSQEALDKFSEPPFQKIYEAHGVEIYFVGLV